MATAAFRFTVAPVSTFAGSAGTNPTERVVCGLIAIDAELALLLELAVDVATIVTEVPVVETGGAV